MTQNIAINEARTLSAEEHELPKGWRMVRLGDVCKQINYGHTASADFKRIEPRFLRITDIQDGKVDWAKVPGCKITESEEEANLLHDGDIVFARTGGTTGKSFLIEKPPRAVFASYLIRLQLRSEVESKYLYLYFQSYDYWRQIWAGAQGGIQPNVNATILSRLNIPLPPTIEEQRRIANILDEQMKAVAQARRAIDEQLEAAKRLPAALLRKAFAGEI